jgi:hypothetical protein
MPALPAPLLLEKLASQRDVAGLARLPVPIELMPATMLPDVVPVMVTACAPLTELSPKDVTGVPNGDEVSAPEYDTAPASRVLEAAPPVGLMETV